MHSRTIHGLYRTRLNRIWNGLIQRCLNERSKDYARYGGRGITVHDEWREFIVFNEWAMNNGYADNLVIDLIDNDDGYFPDNCRFVTHEVNLNNRGAYNHVLTAFGETKTVRQWSRDSRCVVGLKTFESRINRGWPAERAIAEHPNRRQ